MQLKRSCCLHLIRLKIRFFLDSWHCMYSQNLLPAKAAYTTPAVQDIPACSYAKRCCQKIKLGGVKQRRRPGMAAAVRLQACHEIESSLCYAVLLWVPAPTYNVPQPFCDCHIPSFTELLILRPSGDPQRVFCSVLKQGVNSATIVQYKQPSWTFATSKQCTQDWQHTSQAVQGFCKKATKQSGIICYVAYEAKCGLTAQGEQCVEIAANIKTDALQTLAGHDMLRPDHRGIIVQVARLQGAYRIRADVPDAFSQFMSLPCRHITA